jgi:hypothetical protein
MFDTSGDVEIRDEITTDPIRRDDVLSVSVITAFLHRKN